ncbi:MAG: CHC2 zinc finger domain-containing protein, partial [Solirubrobacteraceae bacterium]
LADRGDVYAGAAPRVRRQGSADAIERSWALWVDIDQPDAMSRLEAFEQAPSIVLMTGTPGHALALWPLRTALAPTHLVRANRRLAHALGGDMAATDAARIIRVPQTANFKHDPPAPVGCVRLELAVFEARDVVGHLRDPDEPKRRVAVVTRDLDDRDALAAIPATEYVPALLSRELGRDNKIQCPWHARGQERTPSLHCYPDDRGWFCWPCDRGGDIVTFGALLYGIEARGRGYHEIRERLARDLVAGIEAAA